MNGLCKLCGQTASLQLSHILPAFVFKWLKKTGGPIRYSANVNLRVQDGVKERWLCSVCEEKLSGWETKFANTIFHSTTTTGFPVVRYDEWLLKFCTSVSWRSLSYVVQQTELTNLTEDQRARARRALQTWSEYLRGLRPHPGDFEQHIVPFGPINKDTGIEFPPNANRYLLRNVEIDIGAGRSAAFVFSKLGPVAVLGFIDLTEPKHWPDTRVRLRGGSIKRPPYVLPTHFGAYLASRANRAWDKMGNMSPSQQLKVDTHFRANIDFFRKSDFLAVMERDVEVFGKAAFRRSDDTS